MSLRDGVIVCIRAQLIALALQVFGIWLFLDNIVQRIWNVSDPGPGSRVDTFDSLQDYIWLARMIPVVISIGGFIFLAISPFLREGSGEVGKL
ncbi:hypothetical protein [Methanocella sp. MCL-LM]|uniref:hypothetical protein n=1 Tax=Methanocella sp. MCL-LM TaxID=3412035 RepID=UPI003C76EA12